MIARSLVLTLLAALPASGFSPQEGEDTSEYGVKTKALATVAGHIVWPPGTFKTAQEPFRIGVLGKDPFGEKLEAFFKERTFQGRPIRIQRESEPAKLADCQVVFVSESEKLQLAKVLEGFKGRPTLLIGDTPGFRKQGLGVNLWLEKSDDNTSRTRWEINREALDAAGLKPSAKLLSLAKDAPREEKGP